MRLKARTMPGRDTRTLTDERIEAIAEQVYLAVRRLEASAVRPSPDLSSNARTALPMQPKRSLLDRQRSSGLLHLVQPIQAATEQAAALALEMPAKPDAAGDAQTRMQTRIAPRKARRDLSIPMNVHRMKGMGERTMPDLRRLARPKTASMQGEPPRGRRPRGVDRQQAEVSTTGPPQAGNAETARNSIRS
ncbi:hypothetical protein [Cohnella rhizosphaerae]|uniref:Uncharacterized protein n=1 Tax=Cohnella rhizosphaerae TaxID=1457232 RepID=A0A9X4KVQ3_9BACL|nr:hypothetical protein [Cohnella rhizosphaerae]MDG0808957.1 hypothetical protein [Cohnella rhizosphaerae]